MFLQRQAAPTSPSFDPVSAAPQDPVGVPARPSAPPTTLTPATPPTDDVNADEPRDNTPPPLLQAPIHTLIAGLDPLFVPYERGLAIQRAATNRLERGVDRGTLVILEHEATFTAGNLALPEEYPRDGTPVIPVDRGGKVTWHGPGQLIAYPIIRLRENFGGPNLVRLLEGAIISTIAGFGIESFRVQGRPGVWTGSEDAGYAKIAQVGLRVSSRIVTHGLALNCSNDLAPFSSFIPCGITYAGVTSLSELLGRRVGPRDVAPTLAVRVRSALEEVAA